VKIRAEASATEEPDAGKRHVRVCGGRRVTGVPTTRYQFGIKFMNRKKAIVAGIMITTVTVAIILLVVGKPSFPVIVIGSLSSFIIYGVYAPQKKHKTFGYRDQQRAMRAFDRTELLNFALGSKTKRKKKRKKKV
jgi:4-hydroxybenzoate polyprenyltransferase